MWCTQAHQIPHFNPVYMRCSPVLFLCLLACRGLGFFSFFFRQYVGKIKGKVGEPKHPEKRKGKKDGRADSATHATAPRLPCVKYCVITTSDPGRDKTYKTLGLLHTHTYAGCSPGLRTARVALGLCCRSTLSCECAATTTTTTINEQFCEGKNRSQALLRLLKRLSILCHQSSGVFILASRFGLS